MSDVQDFERFRDAEAKRAAEYDRVEALALRVPAVTSRLPEWLVDPAVDRFRVSSPPVRIRCRSGKRGRWHESGVVAALRMRGESIALSFVTTDLRSGAWVEAEPTVGTGRSGIFTWVCDGCDARRTSAAPAILAAVVHAYATPTRDRRGMYTQLLVEST